MIFQPRRLKSALRNALFLLTPLLLIISPNFTSVMVFEGGAWKKAIGRVLFFLVMFSIPFFFFHKRIKWYLYLLSPLLLLSVIVNYLYIFPRTAINPDILLALLDTNPRETNEFLTNVPVLYWLIGLAAVMIYAFCVARLPKSIKFGQTLIASTACLAIFLLAPVIRFGANGYLNNLSESTVFFYPFNFVTHGKNAWGIRRAIKSFRDDTKNFSFGATKLPMGEKEVHVLVIGETARRANWGLYGYERDTSPRLSNRKLFIFSDATTSGFMTNLSVPILLTRATPQNLDLHLKEKGLLHAFKEAGFATYWINAQAEADNVYIHAEEGEHHLSPTIDFEEKLPKILHSLLEKEKGEKVFLIFHSSGSHWRYDLRYPANFDQFRPSLKQVTALATDRTKRDVIVNSYDNSILYTDFVLDEFIRTLESVGGVTSLTFVSDHGENLMDDSRELSLHGQASVYVAQIPLLIWTSGTYRKNYPEKIQNLNRNRTRKTSSENVFYSVLDLADVKLRDGYRRKSFVSSDFEETERFIRTESGLKLVSDLK